MNPNLGMADKITCFTNSPKYVYEYAVQLIQRLMQPSHVPIALSVVDRRCCPQSKPLLFGPDVKSPSPCIT
jgi:hypothetical protein